MKRRAGLFFAAVASVLATATLATSQISHAYNITLGSPASDLMKGNVHSALQSDRTSYGNYDLLASRSGRPGTGSPAPAPLTVPGVQTTKLNLINSAQPPVVVTITLPAVSQLGGPTQVSELRLNTVPGNQAIAITALNAQQGQATLNTGVTAGLTATTGTTLDGLNVTFGSLPTCPCVAPNCPGGAAVSLPNGTNSFQGTLNPPNTASAPRSESINISAVNGVNSKIRVSLRPNQGNKWKVNGSGVKEVEDFENGLVNVAGMVDQNCGRIGVFPYNSPACVSGPTGPCSPGTPFCSNNANVCKVERASITSGNSFFGGQVNVQYGGAL